jgi:hypothetical protein
VNIVKRVKLQGSKLNFANYDEASRALTIEFYDHTQRLYKGVPYETFVRLSQAPNAQAYFEDRIAEEYPNESVATTNAVNAKAKLDDLFG